MIDLVQSLVPSHAHVCAVLHSGGPPEGVTIDLVGLLKEVSMLLAVVLLFPIAILIVGTPVALLVRLLTEIAERM